MYSETYVKQKEVTILDPMLDADTNEVGHTASPANKRRLAVVRDGAAPTPPEALQRKESGTMFERMLREAVTPEEHALIVLLDEMLDTSWQFDTGKALRGELRRMFTAMGFSDRRFYAAFHGIEKRVCL